MSIVSKSQLGEHVLAAHARGYREGYEAFRRETVEALTERARYYEAQASRTEKSAAFVLDAKTARRVCKILANGVANGTCPPKPKEGA